MRCRCWTAAQMAVMTDREVPMQSSSHERPLSVSVFMGRMRWAAPQAMAQVTTTAQFAQCLARVEACEREGQMCWLKAAVRSATQAAGRGGREAATPAQFPSAASSVVFAERLQRMSSGAHALNAGEAARAGRLVMKGMPWLADQVAWLPNSAPRPMMTAARKASWAGLEELRWRGGICGLRRDLVLILADSEDACCREKEGGRGEGRADLGVAGESGETGVVPGACTYRGITMSRAAGAGGD